MQHSIRASLLYYMTHHFPSEEKLYDISSPTECVSALRHMTSQLPKGINWRDRHGYIVAEELSLAKNMDDEVCFVLY